MKSYFSWLSGNFCGANAVAIGFSLLAHSKRQAKARHYRLSTKIIRKFFSLHKLLCIVALLLCVACARSDSADYPQKLAGADAIEVVFRDAAGKEQIFIKNKRYIKQIANSLAYPRSLKIAAIFPQDTTYADIKFSRRNARHVLLEGTIYKKTATQDQDLFLVCKNEQSRLWHRFDLSPEIQTLLRQARKYPTLLNK